MFCNPITFWKCFCGKNAKGCTRPKTLSTEMQRYDVNLRFTVLLHLIFASFNTIDSRSLIQTSSSDHVRNSSWKWVLLKSRASLLSKWLTYFRCGCQCCCWYNNFQENYLVVPGDRCLLWLRAQRRRSAAKRCSSAVAITRHENDLHCESQTTSLLDVALLALQVRAISLITQRRSV